MKRATITLASRIKPGKNRENPGRQDDHRAAGRFQPILNEKSQCYRNAGFHTVADPERIEWRRGWRKCFARRLQGIRRKRVEQCIEFAKLLDDLLEGQRVSGELKDLLDGNGDRDVGLAKGMEFFAPLRTPRVDLRESGSTAGGIGIRIGENTQTSDRRGMCRFQLRPKVAAEDSFLRQRLNKRLDRRGDPVKA